MLGQEHIQCHLSESNYALKTFLLFRTSHLNDGSMPGQEHIQSHGSSVDKDVHMGTGQSLRLLLQ